MFEAIFNFLIEIHLYEKANVYILLRIVYAFDQQRFRSANGISESFRGESTCKGIGRNCEP